MNLDKYFDSVYAIFAEEAEAFMRDEKKRAAEADKKVFIKNKIEDWLITVIFLTSLSFMLFFSRFYSLKIFVNTFNEPKLLVVGLFIKQTEKIDFRWFTKVKFNKPRICMNLSPQIQICIRDHLPLKMLISIVFNVQFYNPRYSLFIFRLLE